MRSPPNPADPRRHRLVRLDPAAWAHWLSSRERLSVVPVLQQWALKGWPFIVRRSLPEDGDGVPLGLPLPLSLGKQRIALTMPLQAIDSSAALPGVGEVLEAAPAHWRPCLRRLAELSDAFRMRAGVFGSLAWQHATGLDYLSSSSDLDLAWSLPHTNRLDAFLAELAALDAAAPMRLDGELLREDGTGANWRELHAGSTELALKTASGVVLCSRRAFVGALG